MFNLLIKYNGWNLNGSDTIDRTRVFEHTEDAIKDKFRVHQQINFELLRRLPAVLMPEASDSADNNQAARVAQITQIRPNRNNVHIEYTFDQSIPPIANEAMFEMLASAGALNEFEHNRTHWAVKEADLYACIARAKCRSRLHPRVFGLRPVLGVKTDIVAVMMPFSRSFNEVYEYIKQSVTSLGLRCRRADDIWNNESIVQDVVDLIVSAKAVIADCTGRNANVFYEMGIAHTVGRPVVPIVQDRGDIPFDIRHLRHIRYLANREGLAKLSAEINDRLRNLEIAF